MMINLLIKYNTCKSACQHRGGQTTFEKMVDAKGSVAASRVLVAPWFREPLCFSARVHDLGVRVEMNMAAKSYKPMPGGRGDSVAPVVSSVRFGDAGQPGPAR